MCALTSGHDEVAVEFSDDEGLGETSKVLLEQAGNIVRVDISLQFHAFTTVKALTKLQGGKGGEVRGR